MKKIQNFVFHIMIANRDGDVHEEFYLQQSSNVERLAAEQIRCYIEKHYATYEKKNGVVHVYPKDKR
jgi:hypothetical protein